LTALWAARDAKGIKKVIASQAAHLSIKKAARILGLTYYEVAIDAEGQLNPAQLNDLSDACLVLTAGTTATGAIDPLEIAGQAKWTHVDAAWAGPLRLSPNHADVLDGIDRADSIAVSAHKWLFQPKESALILFREPELANSAISFSGNYLAEPNVGVQGSRSAAAIPLLATMIAWGQKGLADRIDRSMSMANVLARKLESNKDIQLYANPKTGVTVFRPLNINTQVFYERLPEGMLSTCSVENTSWLRSVAANPLADISIILSQIQRVMNSFQT
jgi:glutamate/tyrosine decarboxylase-like PLP-dependent enzyme